MANESNGNKVLEYFRLITPVGIFVIGVFVAGIKTDIANLDDKVFKHLTNDEMHTPRNIVVTKSEFDLINEIRKQQFAEIKQDLSEIKRKIK